MSMIHYVRMELSWFLSIVLMVILAHIQRRQRPTDIILESHECMYTYLLCLYRQRLILFLESDFGDDERFQCRSCHNPCRLFDRQCLDIVYLCPHQRNNWIYLKHYQLILILLLFTIYLKLPRCITQCRFLKISKKQKCFRDRKGHRWSFFTRRTNRWEACIHCIFVYV